MSQTSKVGYNLVMDSQINSRYEGDGTELNKRLALINANKKENLVTAEQLIRAFLRPQFKRVDLNGFESDTLIAAFDALKNNPFLSILCLSQTGLGTQPDLYFQALSELLQVPSLQTAHLGLEMLTIPQGQGFSQFLQQHPLVNLKNLLLDIGDDPTGEKTVAILDGVETNQSLEHLQLTELHPTEHFDMVSMPYSRVDIGQKGIERLIAYLQNHPKLQSYQISSHNAKAFSYDLLLQALEVIKTHPALKRLSLSVYDANAEIDKALADAVTTNGHFDFLELIIYPARSEKGADFEELAKVISRIQFVGIQGANLTETAFTNFINSLKNYGMYLEILYLDNLTLTSNQVQQLGDVLQLPGSKIKRLKLPDSVLWPFQQKMADALETMGTAESSLKQLEIESIDINLDEIRQKPKETQIGIFYEIFLAQLEKYKDLRMIEWAEQILKTKRVSYTPITLNVIGESHVLTNDRIPRGFAFFDNLKQAGGDNVPAIVDAWLGVFHFFGSRIDQAQQSFNAAFAKQSDFANSIFYEFAGSTYNNQRNWDQALKYWDIAIARNPNVNARILFAAANLHLTKHLQSLQKEEKLVYLNKATSYYERGLKLPNTVATAGHYQLAGYAHLLAEKWQESTHYYNQCFEKAPSEHIHISAAQYVYAGQAYFMTDNYQSSSLYYDLAFKLAKESNHTLNDISCRTAGAAHAKQGNFARQVEYLGTLRQKEYNDYANLGFAYFQQKQYTQSLEHFEYAFQVNPDADAHIYFNAANAAISLQQWARVAELCELGLTKIDNPEAFVYANLGTAYFNLENWVKADDYLTKAINLAPSNQPMPTRIYERLNIVKTKL